MNKFAVNKSAMITTILMIIRSMIIITGLIPVRIMNMINVMTLTVHDDQDYDHDDSDDEYDDRDHYHGDDDHDYDEQDDD